MTTVVAVDMGRSGARVLRREPGCPDIRRTTPAGAGLGDAGGPAAVAAAVRAAVAAPPTDGPWSLVVGVPGALTHPGAAEELTDLLASGWHGPDPIAVALSSDVVAWHAGAFAAPSPGSQVVLAVGTGAVALGVGADGRVRRVDGHGLLLGDSGGGARLGQEGLRAALRALDGAGPATALAGPAREMLAGRPDSPAAFAGFAPAVLAAADGGDGVARALVDDAVTALAATVDAAGGSRAGTEVAVVGGLADALAPRLADARPDLDLRGPDGDAIAGLLRLLDDPGTAHEPFVTRRAAPVPGQTWGLAAEVDRLPTELVRAGSEELDALTTPVLVARLLDGQAAAPAAVAAVAGALTQAVDVLAEAFRTGGRLVYAGAGTSGRLAMQDAAELPPTFGIDSARALALLAGGAGAAGAAVENAEDDDVAGRADVEAAGVGPGDVLIGVAASGRTPYVLGALRAADDRGAATVAVVNATGSPAAALAGTAIELVTGPEVLAGSTRLAAGTAQKVALNTLTTAAMVRAGATYGPWMVGVRVTNAKLRRRAERIVCDAAGVDIGLARAALADAHDDVATALVALLAGLDGDSARARLAAAGSVRAAVDPEAIG
ncbi:N-acetylmuramic acid 6-phosphate etherase [Actinomycetospora endophytica]|uniref:N-acetylmuramic acid 6-phosphate etherase n=1 Tax=Actinomycetospora endophytica TaxID=2291215 RepID=A0ABS8PEF1_9PSEU|nr:N-acetylmuramic acid 6-phosphate etherase [Actinomycetospora endophytica]MCD2196623.1 N-acetylmuramic acid 6-phosphate etherase [Actinomycetospora endophytica]